MRSTNHRLLLAMAFVIVGALATSPANAVDLPAEGPIATSTVVTPDVWGGSSFENPGWIAALYDGGFFICTSSLIDPWVVLTAAHCVDGPGSYTVRIGSNDRTSGGITRSVAEVHAHPGFHGDFEDPDLALLILDQPATGISPGAVNETGLWPELGQDLTVAGWGRTYSGGPPAGDLQSAEVQATSGMDGAYDPDYCGDLHASARTIGGIFCFGGDVEAGTCAGDSGGPLIGYVTPEATSGELVIYGVVSYGDRLCGDGEHDDKAQSVGGHAAWIESTIRHAIAPVAGDDGSYEVVRGGRLEVAAPGILANDSDPHGYPVTSVLASAPSHGRVELAPDGSFVYEHDGTVSFSDSFTYAARSSVGWDSFPATVELSVSIVDDSPRSQVAGLVDPAQGRWFLYDADGNSLADFYFGNPMDEPFMGDWNCDGTETPGMYRRSDGFVYLRNSLTPGPADLEFYFGNPGDVPIAGDFDGDGCGTVSVYRPSTQTFYIINDLGEDGGGLGAADFSYVFGNPGDKPFVGDFDGDGVDTVGLHRESTGLVYFRNSHTQGIADTQFIFGDPGDRIVAGDWTGGGTDTPALFRPSAVAMYFRFTNSQGTADLDYEPAPSMTDWLPVSGYAGY